MIFEGFGRRFSTANNAQYDAIGAFWDEMSARYGQENLRGLGCHWAQDSIGYVIGPKNGAFPEDEPAPEGTQREKLILPDHHWITYDGETERLSELYDGIYRDGPLDFEIETFSPDGKCRVMIFRKAHVAGALDALLSRRSYRGRYCTDRVPLRDLQTIARAGLEAPSGCNKQTTSLAIVSTPGMMEKVISVIDPPVAATAPAGIFVLTRRVFACRDKCYAVQDYSAAIENMLLAITSLGYASCWFEGHITDTDRSCDRIAQLLGIPEGYELVCFLPVGIPETEAKPPVKRPDSERLFYIDTTI